MVSTVADADVDSTIAVSQDARRPPSVAFLSDDQCAFAVEVGAFLKVMETHNVSTFHFLFFLCGAWEN